MALKKILLPGIYLLVVISVLTSCVSARKKPQIAAPRDAKKELSQVQMDFAAKADRRAINRLNSLIKRYPGTDVADDAAMQLAHYYYRKQSYEHAYRAFMSIVDSDVFSSNESEALLGASKCLHKMGRLDESLALSARGLQIPGISDKQKLEFYRHRYSVLVTTGDKLDALRALAFIHDNDPKSETKVMAQTRASEIVNQYLNHSDLEKVVRDSAFGFVRAQAAYRLGLHEMQQKNFSSARSMFERAADWGRDTPVQGRAQNYLAQIEATQRVDPNAIGVVLPLSGRYAPIAQKTLRGIQLGLGVYGPDRARFRLAVMDSEGQPDQARKAVERLALEDSVIAVIGSLLSRTAYSVAEKAEELGIPSIALSQKAGLTESGAFIFRNAVTSEMQVKELVQLAMDQLGMKRFAIMYPNDSFGVEYANLFWDEVLARGGTIAGAQVYNSSETDFRGPIRRLVGTYYVEDRKTEYRNRVRDWFRKQTKVRTRKAPPDDLLPPIIDFDAIFIPDSPKAMGQIAPMLAYQGVNTRLLGTNVWNSNELIRRAQKNVDRAIFIDSSLTNDPNFRQTKFYRDFTRAFGEEPGVFEAQGFEAGVLLRKLLSEGQSSRSGLASALSRIRQFQGVSGPMSMNEHRELVRPLTPFIIKDNQITTWHAAFETQKPQPKKTIRK